MYEVSCAFMRKWFHRTLACLAHRLPTTSLNIKTHLTHFVLHCNSPPRVVIQSIKQSFFILLSIYLHLSSFFSSSLETNRQCALSNICFGLIGRSVRRMLVITFVFWGITNEHGTCSTDVSIFVFSEFDMRWSKIPQKWPANETNAGYFFCKLYFDVWANIAATWKPHTNKSNTECWESQQKHFISFLMDFKCHFSMARGAASEKEEKQSFP